MEASIGTVIKVPKCNVVSKTVELGSQKRADQTARLVYHKKQRKTTVLQRKNRSRGAVGGEERAATVSWRLCEPFLLGHAQKGVGSSRHDFFTQNYKSWDCRRSLTRLGPCSARVALPGVASSCEAPRQRLTENDPILHLSYHKHPDKQKLACVYLNSATKPKMAYLNQAPFARSDPEWMPWA